MVLGLITQVPHRGEVGLRAKRSMEIEGISDEEEEKIQGEDRRSPGNDNEQNSEFDLA